MVLSPTVDNFLLISYLPITKCSASPEAQLKVDHADRGRLTILKCLEYLQDEILAYHIYLHIDQVSFLHTAIPPHGPRVRRIKEWTRKPVHQSNPSNVCQWEEQIFKHRSNVYSLQPQDLLLRLKSKWLQLVLSYPRHQHHTTSRPHSFIPLLLSMQHVPTVTVNLHSLKPDHCKTSWLLRSHPCLIEMRVG